MLYGFDFAKKKKQVFCNEDGNIDKIDFSNFDDFVKEDSEVYVEPSIPSRFAYYLSEGKNCDIFAVKVDYVEQEREKKNREKSDENDAQTLMEIGRDNLYEVDRFSKKELEKITTEFNVKLWRKFDKLQTTIQNRLSGWKDDYPKEIREELEEKMLEDWSDELENKKEVIKRVINARNLVLSERLMEIDGIAENTAMKLIGEADPRDFHSQSAYLVYLGFTGKAREDYKYNRWAKSVVWTTARRAGVIKKSNYQLTKLYDLFKEGRDVNGEDGDSLDDNQAKNRIATFLAKEIYWTGREEEPKDCVNLASDVLEKYDIPTQRRLSK